jgi:NAD(P)-dependent dehydrogenase (short-subunit alcohol dehydrogenase family)
VKLLLLMTTILTGLLINPLAGQAGTQPAVLVTGASSGIGRTIATTLAAQGYYVYAGARKQKDLDALNKLDNVSAIALDVTKQTDIDAAVKTIAEAGRGLYGLVNNAGVSNYEALVEVEVDTLQFVFDVNVFGVYRVTKAFMPLIIEAKGRVTSISSMAGVVSSPIMGVYSMSKHAVEAYTDTLAVEVARLGVKVSVIEPGRFRSQINQSAIKRMAAADPMSPWAKEKSAMLNRDRSADKDPQPVADAVVHALFSDAPKRRYLVVPDPMSAAYTVRWAMQEMLQLNEGHAYSLDRAALLKMLAESLAE